jgi:hypothetical protein
VGRGDRAGTGPQTVTEEESWEICAPGPAVTLEYLLSMLTACGVEIDLR